MGRLNVRVAGLREEGVPCPGCDLEIQHGQRVTFCESCGTANHVDCWEEHGGCAQFDCEAAVLDALEAEDRIQITASDLDNARLLPESRPTSLGPRVSIPVGPDLQSTQWNKLALVAFGIALLSIPLYGIVTGLLAVVVGGVSLVGKNAFRRRGIPFAAAAIVLGIGSFVGWAVYYSQNGAPGRIALGDDDFEPDPSAFENLSPEISQAMKANVLIQTGGLLQQGIGSGVILQIQDGSALIVTNRHVIDLAFSGRGGTDLADLADVFVKALGEDLTAAKVVWIAPDDIDLALLRMPVSTGEQLASAWWRPQHDVHVGDAVFAVGNPHGLGWTHTSGQVSQLRRQNATLRNYGVIQTTAAINSGNSGGGLYDSEGRLVGINTWTRDKRMAEGLGFAIVFHTLLELLDGEFQLPQQQQPTETP